MLPSNVIKGNRLTPEGRQFFVSSARALYETKKAQYDRAKSFYEEQARAAGLDPGLIFRDFSASEPKPTIPPGYHMEGNVPVKDAPK